MWDSFQAAIFPLGDAFESALLHHPPVASWVSQLGSAV
jgi:hypothetical protein